jgi:hypothetical protein
MNEENRQKLSQLAERAWTNEALRKELLSDPTLVIKENGIEIPKGFDVEALADKESISFNLVPQKQQDASELSDSNLEAITGGTGKSGGTMYLVFTFKLVAVKTVS